MLEYRVYTWYSLISLKIFYFPVSLVCSIRRRRGIFYETVSLSSTFLLYCTQYRVHDMETMSSEKVDAYDPFTFNISSLLVYHTDRLRTPPKTELSDDFPIFSITLNILIYGLWLMVMCSYAWQHLIHSTTKSNSTQTMPWDHFSQFFFTRCK